MIAPISSAAGGVPLALEWGQFGLGGVVIGALFWLIWTMGKRTDAQLERHGKERTEWRESQEKRDSDMSAALQGLTEAIWQSSVRPRPRFTEPSIEGSTDRVHPSGQSIQA